VEEAVKIGPWVVNDDERSRAEARLGSFVGRSIAAVRYTEIQSGQPAWSANGFDSVDYGIEFDLDDGSTWSVIWEQRGHNEGLGIRSEALAPARLLPDAETSVWNVTSRWIEAVGPTIKAVNGSWQRTEFGPGRVVSTGEQVAAAGASDLCLEAVAFDFEQGPALITLGGAEPDGSFTRWARDNISIFFSLAAARSVGVPTPGETGW
jgi:hypothetical protein